MASINPLPLAPAVDVFVLGGTRYDADNFWAGLKKLGPTDILEIVGDEGGRIRIWIE